MQKSPEGKATWRDWTLIVAVLLTVGALLFAPLFARAGEPYEALVLICPRDDMASCTVATARIFFKVKIESPVPSGCLALAQAKAAEVESMWDPKTETPKIACGR